MSGKSSSLSRLLRILTLAQGGERWTPALLADELSVSERQVYRDLKHLKAGGVPIDFDRGAKKYVVGRPFFLPPVDLTPTEACALMLLTERLHDADVLPTARPAETAMQKLRAALPAALREALDGFMPRVRIDPARTEPSSIEDVWAQLSWAIAERRTVRVGYDPASASDPAEEETEAAHDDFRFDPYDLYFGQRAWYVVGHHHGRGEPRTLRLSRFTRCQPTDQTFNAASGFSLDAYFGQAWRMIPGDRRRHRVRLRFAPAVAETVSETLWHRTQAAEHHDDGGVTLRFEIDGLNEIVWWILGYGPHCVVEEPAELRELVATISEATTRLYTES
ncbi:MAG: WYL domain-containing protein [Planctomycetota bacterium]